jgi:uncharacterized membrane protein
VIADALFTATAAVLQPLSGLGLYAMTGLPWRQPWLWVVLGVIALYGLMVFRASWW